MVLNKKTLVLAAGIALSCSTAGLAQSTAPTDGSGVATTDTRSDDDDGDKWGWLGLLGLAGLLGLKRKDNHDHRTTNGTSSTSRL